MQCCNTKSYNNTAKYTHLKRCDSTNRCRCSAEHILGATINVDQCTDGCMHNKKCNRCCKCCNVFFFLCHTNGNTHGKNNRQIGKYNVTGTTHNLKYRVQDCTRSHDSCQPISIQHGLVCERTADSEQKSCYRQYSDGKHKRSSYTLKDTKNFVFHSFFSFSFSFADICGAAGRSPLSACFRISVTTKRGTNTHKYPK